MKIASIGMQARGGAGLSSLKLHEEFVRQGHESRFYVAKETMHVDKTILIPTKRQYKQNWWSLGTVPLIDGIENIVSSGLAGKSSEYLEEVYDWADIILLRWLTSTVSDFQISSWSVRKKPLFWCLSDMAPFTGGCHYSRGCRKYEDSCSNCEIVAPIFRDIPSIVITRRKRLWKNIHVISPSLWLAKCSRNSKVFSDKEISVVRTGVELDVFTPTERRIAKNSLGIPPDSIAFCFGADSISDDRKGFDLLQHCLYHFVKIFRNTKNIKLILVGDGGVENLKLPFQFIHLGNIGDRKKLAEIYSAADVTILPYKEDNLPNVMLESIACGTPVVAFDIGGMPDIIKTGINGALATPHDPYGLAVAVSNVLTQNLKQADLRKWAEDNLGVEQQAQKYITLFENALE